MNDLMSKSFLSYVELKKQALKDLEAGPDMEMGKLSPTNEENLLQFFEEVESIKTEMEHIRNLLVDLQGLNEETKSAHTAKVLRGLRDRMDSDMVTVLRKAKIIKVRLEALDKSNVVNRTISMSYREGSHIDRTRMSVTNGLRIKLRDLMNDFNTLREVIVSDHKEGLKRRYLNATGEVPSEEVIEKMMSEGVEQVEVFVGQAELNLENQERQKAVNSIQRSLMDLHKVFLDMAVLVEAQGEQIDDIEMNVGRAGEMISGGTDALVAAKSMKKRNWVCLVVMILIGVGLLLSSFIFLAIPSTS
ncbi:Target SNARE coiled-coil domain [Macleaya cordata]|uniref:Target SNARE coiled-coil domain n=1 Tax=Macleaya cordata TaxID=56857 RepID=A0A200PLK0_MACCD|nr:Target SNARE coiled-coil domain [Macleaya cordata]